MRHGLRFVLVGGVAATASLVLLAGAGAQQEHEVAVIDDEFVPAEITVDAGDSVRWVAPETNLDVHQVHQDSHLFNVELAPGQSADWAFTSSGTYPYHCDFHPGMRGTVVVEAVVPGAPGDVEATAGVGAATVSWSPPELIGGSVLTEYVVTTRPGGQRVSVPAEATTTTIAGLEPATVYRFEVAAVNVAGTGPGATSNAVTPTAPVPDPGPTPTPSPDPSPSPEPTPDPDPDAGPCPEDVAPALFTDRDAIPSTHRGSVDCASSLAVVTGFADGTYRPTLSVRRDQMASFIARSLDAAGVTLPAPAEQRFTDVAPGSTHDDAIHRLAAAGIVQGGAGGLPATAYGGDQGVRRDQMGSFLLRAAAFAAAEDLASHTQAFPDVGAGNPHFADVNGAAQVGLVTGFADGTYGPGAGVRRDQMATFVVRLLDHRSGRDDGRDEDRD